MNMYRLREGREMSPQCFKTVVSNLLYERRSDNKIGQVALYKTIIPLF